MNLENRIQDYVKYLEDIPKIDLEYKTDMDLKRIIFDIITSSRFRRTALDQTSKIDLVKKIEEALRSNLPIEFSIPFGAYKSFRLKSYNGIYWSEVFNITYIIRYLLPISKIYKPGVIVSYSYHRDVMQDINNISSADLEEYQDVFSRLLSYYNDKLPQNFRLRMQAINDLYASEQDWQNELKEQYVINREKWLNEYDEEAKNKKLASAGNNFAINGEKDFSQLSSAEIEQKVLHSAIMVDSIESLSKRRPFNKSTHRIQLVFLRGPRPAVHIGVCDGSTNQFWVGLGFLEIRKDRIIPKIAPFGQIKEFEKRGVKTVFSEISDKFDTICYEEEKI